MAWQPDEKTPLMTWLYQAKIKLREGKCTSEQASRLAMMGVMPAQIKAEITKTFDDWTAELEVWREENPETFPPRNSPLRGWLERAKVSLRDKKFTTEQEGKLTAMGVRPAKVQAEITKTTEKWIAELEQWQIENPGESPARNTLLGKWLERAKVKLRDGKFTPEQATLLRTMRIQPSQFSKTAEEWIAELEQWQKNPEEWSLTEKRQLQQWLDMARRYLRDGKFTPAQASKLTALGIQPARVKAEIEKTFDEWTAELELWQKENPRERPSNKTSLGQWLAITRIKLRDGKLTPEQATLLRAMGVQEAKKKA
jgi:hypothetical protein